MIFHATAAVYVNIVQLVFPHTIIPIYREKCHLLWRSRSEERWEREKYIESYIHIRFLGYGHRRNMCI